MKLLLASLLCLVLLGLVTDRLDRRTYSLVLGVSVMTTVGYFFVARFMS